MNNNCLILIAFVSVVLSCQKSVRFESSIERVERVAVNLFGDGVVGPIARSGKSHGAAVLFSVENVPPSLQSLLDHAVEKEGLAVRRDELSATWVPSAEIWVVKIEGEHDSFSLKIVDEGVTKFIVLMDF